MTGSLVRNVWTVLLFLTSLSALLAVFPVTEECMLEVISPAPLLLEDMLRLMELRSNAALPPMGAATINNVTLFSAGLLES